MTAILANVTGTAGYAPGMVLRMNEPDAARSVDAFGKELHACLQDPCAKTQRRTASEIEGDLSHHQIATAPSISNGVVTRYVGLAVTAGLDAASLAALNEADLECRTLAWEEYCAQTSDEHTASNPIKP